MPSEFPKPVAPGQPLLCLVTPPVLEEGQPGRSLFLSPLLRHPPEKRGGTLALGSPAGLSAARAQASAP